MKNSTFARNGRQGWTINGQDITFEHNIIRETRRATVDLEPATTSSVTRRVMIRNNTIGAGRLYFLANEGRGRSDRGHLGHRQPVRRQGDDDPRRPPERDAVPVPGHRQRERHPRRVQRRRRASSSATSSASRCATTCSRCRRAGTSPASRLRDSRNVVVSGNRFPYGRAPVYSRGGNFNVSQSANHVGNPLKAARDAVFPGPY